MTTQELAKAVMKARGLASDDPIQRRRMVKRIGDALSRQRRNGLVKSNKGTGLVYDVGSGDVRGDVINTSFIYLCVSTLSINHSAKGRLCGLIRVNGLILPFHPPLTSHSPQRRRSGFPHRGRICGVINRPYEGLPRLTRLGWRELRPPLEISTAMPTRTRCGYF